jgi:hypothetical protein
LPLRPFAALIAALALIAPAFAQAQTARFIAVAPGVPGVLYAPDTPGEKATTAVLIMHSGADYLTFPGCTELAKRGYRAFCVNNSSSKSGAANDGQIDQVLLELKAAMLRLRAEPGVRRVVLLGHSGGGTIMSAYQMIAEGGTAACQGAEKIWKCPDTLAGLPPADGLMLVDSNWGLAAMTLFSLDPAVTDPAHAQALDPALDMFNPANGFRATGSHYDGAFVHAFLAAEQRRNADLLRDAQARWATVRAGQGQFADDEPLTVPGANLFGFNNKLFSQDTALMAATEGAYPLLHADGSTSTEVIHSVRVPENTRNVSPLLNRGALKTSLRGYLSTYAIRTGPDYGYDGTHVTGVDWRSTYASPPGNVTGISVPLLVMGMTGHWEYLAAETIWRMARSRDKTIAFVEGATHLYDTCKACEPRPGAYGDTLKTTYDAIDRWLSKPGRWENAR